MGSKVAPSGFKVASSGSGGFIIVVPAASPPLSQLQHRWLLPEIVSTKFVLTDTIIAPTGIKVALLGTRILLLGTEVALLGTRIASSPNVAL
jgi:hypothetical protein